MVVLIIALVINSMIDMTKIIFQTLTFRKTSAMRQFPFSSSLSLG
jgi:hypothetical protein